MIKHWFVQAPNINRRPRLRLGRIFLGAYAVVLAASTVVRLLQPAEQPLALNQKAVRVAAIDHDRVTDQQVRLSYYEYGDPTRPTLILLHGMSGAGSEFDRAELVQAAQQLGACLTNITMCLRPIYQGLALRRTTFRIIRFAPMRFMCLG